jgi:Tetratricopeptide repeat
LATSLNNLGIRRSNLGRREDALAAGQEAVDLAETRPDAFLPDLAASLGTLGRALATAERYAEAAVAAPERIGGDYSVRGETATGIRQFSARAVARL